MNKAISIFVTASLVLVVFYTSSCKKKKITTYDCTGVTPTYTADVKSILDAHCATSGCHSAASHAKGIDLSSYSSSNNAAGNDNFIGSIQHASGYNAMPQGASQLDDATIKTLSCWVQNGRPE
jgi:hypothetical protein